MHLVQILLPLYDNDGAVLARDLFRQVRDELTDRFGGLTAFTRAPAEGSWAEHGETRRDEIVVYEVMVDAVDRAWWAGYRHLLERRFRQERIVVRASVVELL